MVEDIDESQIGTGQTLIYFEDGSKKLYDNASLDFNGTGTPTSAQYLKAQTITGAVLGEGANIFQRLSNCSKLKFVKCSGFLSNSISITNCPSLEYIYIKVTFLSYLALFNNNPSLVSAVFDIDDTTQTYALTPGMFYNDTHLRNVSFSIPIANIPSSSSSNGTFENCTALETLYFPYSASKGPLALSSSGKAFLNSGLKTLVCTPSPGSPLVIYSKSTVLQCFGSSYMSNFGGTPIYYA